MQDLNSLIDPSSGWYLEDANGINDAGQIVGTGIDPSGMTEAFLLTPTPEPASGSLVVLAACGALLARRRREA
jgi:probable HAF family extracellular repeat protein